MHSSNNADTTSTLDCEAKGRKTVASLLKTFAENTSMHGLGRVASSRFLWLRLFWAVLVLTGACVAAYNVVSVILLYFTYPVSTAVTVEYEPEIQFPAVTICNLNLLRKSQLDSNKHLKEFDLMPELYDVFNDTRHDDDYDYDYDEDYDFEVFDAAKVFDEGSRLMEFLTTQSRDDRRFFGHQLEDMLLTCSFSGRICSEENFTAFLNHKYGNCFTFNKNGQASLVSRAGPAYGLKMLLNAEEEEYIVTSETVGFKVVIHPPDEMPFPEDEGIMVSPGFTNSIAIRRKDIRRTSSPYGSCHEYDEAQHPRHNMYASLYSVSYSDKACYRTCFQTAMHTNCGCCHRDYPCYVMDPRGKEEDVPFCNLTLDHIASCSAGVEQMYQDDLLGCESTCLPSCWESTYVSETSSGRWPALPRMPKTVAYLRKLNKQSSSDPDSSSDQSPNITRYYLRNNVAHVSIYYKQLNFEQIKTSPAYDWSRLLSDLGGQFGLWLGFSLLTAVEIIQLFVEIIHHVGCHVCNLKGKPARVRSDELNPGIGK